MVILASSVVIQSLAQSSAGATPDLHDTLKYVVERIDGQKHINAGTQMSNFWYDCCASSLGQTTILITIDLTPDFNPLFPNAPRTPTRNSYTFDLAQLAPSKFESKDLLGDGVLCFCGETVGQKLVIKSEMNGASGFSHQFRFPIRNRDEGRRLKNAFLRVIELAGAAASKPDPFDK